MNEKLMAEYSLSEDTWDDNLGWCFAVAEAIYHTIGPSDVPAEMKFRHAAAFDDEVWQEDSYETEVIAEMLNDGWLQPDELIEFAMYVNDKDNAFRAAGENF